MKNEKPKNNRNGMGDEGGENLKAKGCQPGHPIFSRGANDSSFLFIPLPHLKKLNIWSEIFHFHFKFIPLLPIYTHTYFLDQSSYYSHSPSIFTSHPLSLSPSLCFQLSLSHIHTLTLTHTQRKPSLRLWRLACSSSIFDLLSLRRRYTLSKVSLLRSEVLFYFLPCYLVRFSFVYGLRPFDLILTSIGSCTI